MFHKKFLVMLQSWELWCNPEEIWDVMAVSWFSCSFSLSFSLWGMMKMMMMMYQSEYFILSIVRCWRGKTHSRSEELKIHRELRCFWESCASSLLPLFLSLSFPFPQSVYLSLSHLCIHRPEITSSMYKWYLLLCPKGAAFYPSFQSVCFLLLILSSSSGAS